MKVPFIALDRAHDPIRGELLDAFARTLDHGEFCLGSEVSSFESGFATVQGLSRVVGVGSGTEALHLIACALDLGPGDEVIVPAFTFVASAWLAKYVGAQLVFADIDPKTYTIDPKSIESRLTSNTKAIVATHLFGQSADMDAIQAIADLSGAKVVEDAAQAHLARYKEKPVGEIGDAGAFSFYPTKNLGGLGEGGCVSSNDDDLLDKVAILRAHGSKERYLNHFVGYNNRMEGLQAAALNVKLPYLKANTARRLEIADRYFKSIQLDGGILPQEPEWGRSVFHMFTVQHPERDRLRSYLSEKGIGTDIVYPYPLHLQPCFASLGYGPGDFPEAEKLAKHCLSLPIVPELTDPEIDYVIDSLNAFS